MRRYGAIITGVVTVDLCGVFCALAPWMSTGCGCAEEPVEPW